MILRALILWLAICGASVRAEWQTFTAKVVSVHDGDTITVEARASDHKLYRYKVRLLYIDAPELKQPGGEEARNALALRAVPGSKVKVHWEKRDRYGRVLGSIGYEGGLANIEMVASGNAWYYRDFPPKDTGEKAAYASAEGSARRGKDGLWAQKHPIPPWEWRRERRER